ncbi:MAG: hypothetical protein COB78_05180 [Hyphomicrobiales bacterium]|nr:MAG: hypothetical protein COB78_05180 [Hyphomicrobiales bacterium]
MGFFVKGLSAEPYMHLYGLSDKALAEQGVKRYVADASPGFPDRIEMREAEPGERLLLLNYVSQPKNTPYRASHAIFILEGAKETYEGINKVPPVMFTRLLSLRAFDVEGMMVDAGLAKGKDIEATIERFFKNDQISCIHAHNALRGCYSGKIDRR